MRKIIIRQDKHIAPFNEPAFMLRVLNKPLWEWQRTLFSPYMTEEAVVDHFSSITNDAIETLVYQDNLWCNEAFLSAFLTEARRRGKPARAAIRQNDPAYFQQGLRTLSTSSERKGDLYYLDLWYFPSGVSSQTDPVIIESNPAAFRYYRMLAPGGEGQIDLEWQIPTRAVCVVDTWVHLFFINVVFGLAGSAAMGKPGGDAASLLRSLLDRRPFQSAGANVTVGENCHIDPGTQFSGNVVIGNNVTIGPGCVISECIIGNEVTLAHGNRFYMCVLSDDCFFPGGASAYFSVFMEHSTAGQNASLEMSVVGRNSAIGAGTIFTNTNLLPGAMQLTIDYDPLEVDIPVLGGCVGHNCRVGSGLVVYPGRTIESDVVLMPSPNRRVIMNDISYEESDHHAMLLADDLPRRYPRREGSGDW